ncbi:MAG: hypothetical protein RLZZ59_489 [Pseudomonadota bacterium]|jgi:streptomycin 6-kinase
MTTFHSNIINIYGSPFAATLLRRDKEKGKALVRRSLGEGGWLNELPELVSAIASRLDLHDLQEVTNLTYNYVLSGFQGDNPIILKLGLDNEALAQEEFALKCFAGYSAVKVLAEDDLPDEALAKAGGMLLLERVVPGASLRGVCDEAIQNWIATLRSR